MLIIQTQLRVKHVMFEKINAFKQFPITRVTTVEKKGILKHLDKSYFSCTLKGANARKFLIRGSRLIIMQEIIPPKAPK